MKTTRRQAAGDRVRATASDDEAFALHHQLVIDAIERVESYLNAIPRNPDPVLRGPICFGYVCKWLRCARTNVNALGAIVAAEMANKVIARHWQRKVIPHLRRYHSMPIAVGRGET